MYMDMCHMEGGEGIRYGNTFVAENMICCKKLSDKLYACSILNIICLIETLITQIMNMCAKNIKLFAVCWIYS